MSATDDLREKGYTVTKVNDDMLYIEGWGISLYIHPNNSSALASLNNQEAHMERVYQAEHGHSSWETGES
jgi:hypothetical protein